MVDWSKHLPDVIGSVAHAEMDRHTQPDRGFVQIIMFRPSLRASGPAIAIASYIHQHIRFRNTFSSFIQRLTVHALEDGVQLSLECTVLDREDGQSKALIFNRMIGTHLHIVHYTGDELQHIVAPQVIDFFRTSVMHEVDECLTIEGVRMCDPHRYDPAL